VMSPGVDKTSEAGRVGWLSGGVIRRKTKAVARERMERLLQETKNCSWWNGERTIRESHLKEMGITGLDVQAAAAVLQASAGVSTQQHTLTSPQKFS
jgi:hypothetical protein